MVKNTSTHSPQKQSGPLVPTQVGRLLQDLVAGAAEQDPDKVWQLLGEGGAPLDWEPEDFVEFVDHIKPLECGGADAPSNMQWQSAAAAKAKDRTERSCR